MSRLLKASQALNKEIIEVAPGYFSFKPGVVGALKEFRAAITAPEYPSSKVEKAAKKIQRLAILELEKRWPSASIKRRKLEVEVAPFGVKGPTVVFELEISPKFSHQY